MQTNQKSLSFERNQNGSGRDGARGMTDTEKATVIGSGVSGLLLAGIVIGIMFVIIVAVAGYVGVTSQILFYSVSVLETEVDSNDADIAEIKQEIVVIDQEITTINTEITVINGNITTLQDEIDTLEQNITDIDFCSLDDVICNSLNQGNVPVYHTAQQAFVSQAITCAILPNCGPSGPTALENLTDVSVADRQPGDFLVYNGSVWTNEEVQPFVLENTNDTEVLFNNNGTVDGSTDFTFLYDQAVLSVGQPTSVDPTVTTSLFVGNDHTANGTGLFISGGNNTITSTGDYNTIIGSDNVISGTFSNIFVGGQGSTASGEASFSFGIGCLSPSQASFSTGSGTEARNIGAASFGLGTLASGAQSLAGGTNTRASGRASFSHGDNTVASGIAAAVFGVDSTASGNVAFAVGTSAVASGANSVAIGNGANADNSNAIAIGQNADAGGVNGMAIGTNAETSGSQNLAIGLNSLVGGSSSIGIGRVSLPTGANTVVAISAASANTPSYTGNEILILTARAAGAYTGVRVYSGNSGSQKLLTSAEHGAVLTWTYTPITPGDWTSSGGVPTTIGQALDILVSDFDEFININTSSSNTQVLFNNVGVIEGNDGLRFFVLTASVAMGDGGNVASGNYSFAGGPSAMATAEGSLAFGTNGAEASGAGSVAIGSGVIANGTASQAFGVDSTASGDNSFVSGQSSEATASGSFAMGFFAISSGTNSFALGPFTEASASRAVAIGNGAVSSSSAHITIGKGTGTGNGGVLISAVNIGNTGPSLGGNEILHLFGYNGGGYAGVQVHSGNDTDFKSIQTALHGDFITWTYTPINVSDWDTSGGVPSTIGQALDILAADFSQFISLNTTSDNTQVLFNNLGVIEGNDGLRFFVLTASVTVGTVGNVASGDNSFAGGDSSEASGLNSFAYGNQCDATGEDSFATGDRTVASGKSAFASGTLTQSNGQNSFAVGGSALANTTNSIAIGANSQSTGQAAVCIGFEAIARGATSVTIGRGEITSGNGAVLISATPSNFAAPSFLAGGGRLNLFGHGFLAEGEYSAVRVHSGNATNFKSMQTEEHGATTISWTYDAQVDADWISIAGVVPTNLGQASDILADVVANNLTIDANAFSSDTQVIFNNGGNLNGDAGLEYFVATTSLTLGSANTATGDHSFAGGVNTRALGADSFAYGSQCNATGDDSFSIGDRTDATGDASFAGGLLSQANGAISFSYGSGAASNADNCVALGTSTICGGFACTAIGRSASAAGNSQTSIGRISMTSGSGSIAIGATHPADTMFSFAAQTGLVHIYGFGPQTTGSYDSVRIYAGPSGSIKSIFTQEHGATSISWAYDAQVDADWISIAGVVPTNLGQASDILVDVLANNLTIDANAFSSDTEVLFNDNGAIVGEPAFTYDTSFDAFSIGTQATISSGSESVNVGSANAIDAFRAVSVGTGNTVGTGGNSTITTGQDNTNSGANSLVYGNNCLANGTSSFSGGNNNINTGNFGVVIGGSSNQNTNGNAAVIGGNSNVNSGASSAIAGGSSLTNNANFVFMAGGQTNDVDTSPHSSIVAGTDNVVVGSTRSAIFAGDENIANVAVNSVLIGGQLNNITGTENAGAFAGVNNLVLAARSVAVGGAVNVVSNFDAAIIGGSSCLASGMRSAVIGGVDGEARAANAVVIGGDTNVANGARSVALGGFTNTASGISSVAGGDSSTSSGTNSFAFGNQATASATGTVVFSNNAIVGGTAGRFYIAMTGGTAVYTDAAESTGVTIAPGASSWAAVSDINKKENLHELNYTEVLEKVGSMPIYRYNYIGSPENITYMTPVAQDWHPRFPSGKDNLTLEITDLAGVALASAKGVYQQLLALQDALGYTPGTSAIGNFTGLQDTIETINSTLVTLSDTVSDHEERIDTLEASVNVYGTQFQHASSEGTSSTGSTSFVQKVSLSTPSNLPSGTYRIGWYVEYSATGIAPGVEIRVQLDNSPSSNMGFTSKSSLLSSEDYTFSGFKYETLDEGVHSVDMDFRSTSGLSTTAVLKSARLEVWRVS